MREYIDFWFMRTVCGFGVFLVHSDAALLVNVAEWVDGSNRIVVELVSKSTREIWVGKFGVQGQENKDCYVTD